MAESKPTRRLPQVNLQVLNTFLAVRNFGSAEGAAPQVHLTTSAVSRQIKDLEGQLGVKLFERHARGMRLTAEGDAYTEAAQRVLAELDRAGSELDAIENNVRGHVRVHISEVLVDDYFLPVIQAVREEYPQITVEAMISSADQSQEALLHGLTDFATVFRATQHDDIIEMEKYAYPLIAVVSPEHELARTGVKTIAPMALLDASLALAIPPAPFATRLIFESLLKNSVAKSHKRDYPSLTLNSFTHLKRHVMRGRAVAVMPALTVQRELKAGKLVSIQIIGANDADTRFSLCQHRTRPLSAEARLFFSRFKESLEPVMNLKLAF